MKTSNALIGALLAGSSALTLSTAHAQEQSSGGFAGIEEIMVSATKRNEGLQDVPISVTAFSQAELDMRGFNNLAGVQEATPNLNFSVQSAGQNVARVTLRGIGTETLVGGGDPGVALHIDGIYVGRNSVAAGDIFDVERVEVLRGPQGTLFGRNATGGSVNIITKRPQFEMEAMGDITYGNYDALRVRGTINVPLSDHFAARVTGYSDSRDGFFNNLFEEGRDGADKNAQGGRFQLLWDNQEGASVLLRGYYNKYGGVGPGSKYLGDDLTTANGLPPVYLIGIGAMGQPLLGPAFAQGTTTAGDPIQDAPEGFFDVRKNEAEFLDQVIKGVDLEASFNVSDSILLKAIASYQSNDNEIFVDADNTELALETRRRDNEAEQFTVELNLFSQNDSPFQWIAGLYYYKEELTEIFENITQPNVIPGSGGARQFRDAMHELDSFAVFAQLSYQITDDLKLTGGIRHTWDDKFQARTTGGNIGLDNNVRFMGMGATGPLAPDTGDVKFSELTYRVSLDYSITPDNLLFASYARGYKSGGFDFNGGQLLNGDDLVPYNPEFVDAFEIGSKNKFLNNRALLNLTAFYYDYKDLQVFRLTGFGPLTDNAAQSTIWGIEAEAKFAATEFLNFDASLGYLNTEYDEYTIDRPPTDFGGNQLNYAPEVTAHIGVEYSMPVGENMLTTRLDWSWRSDTFFDRSNSPLDTQEAYSLVNTRVRYDAETWYVDVFARNLLDKEYINGQLINPPFSCGCRTVNLGAPRTYGVTFGARF